LAAAAVSGGGCKTGSYSLKLKSFLVLVRKGLLLLRGRFVAGLSFLVTGEPRRRCLRLSRLLGLLGRLPGLQDLLPEVGAFAEEMVALVAVAAGPGSGLPSRLVE